MKNPIRWLTAGLLALAVMMPTARGASTLGSGLLAWLPDMRTDQTGRGNDFAPVSPTNDPDHAAGPFGGDCILTNPNTVGKNTFLQRASTTDLQTAGTRFYSLWVRLDAKPTANPVHFLRKGDTADRTYTELDLNYYPPHNGHPGDRLEFYIGNGMTFAPIAVPPPPGPHGRTWVDANTFGSPPVGVWLNLQAAYLPGQNADGRVRIRVNGGAWDTVIWLNYTPSTTAGKCNISSWTDNPNFNYFTPAARSWGLAIWNRELTEAESQQVAGGAVPL